MGHIIAFIMWVIIGLAFIVMGIIDIKSKKTKPFSFWANAKAPEVKDVRAYNRAVGKLFIFFGIFLVVLGFPLLAGDNSPYVLISIIGTMFMAIAVMIIYTVKIESVYRK